MVNVARSDELVTPLKQLPRKRLSRECTQAQAQGQRVQCAQSRELILQPAAQGRLMIGVWIQHVDINDLIGTIASQE